MKEFLNKLRDGRKVTIVALGDSNTELTWHTRGRLNWCGCLQEAMFETYGRNRCLVISAGRCGDTAGGALGRLDEDVLRFDPDLVIIGLGLNDACAGVAVDDFCTAMVQIIDRVLAHNQADVLLRTPNPIVNPPNPQVVRDGQPIAMELAGTRVAEFARAIVEIAESKGCSVVDHYRIWKRLEALRGRSIEEPNCLWLRMSDAVHPGPLGHLAFFRELAPLLCLPQRFPWEAAGPDDGGTDGFAWSCPNDSSRRADRAGEEKR